MTGAGNPDRRVMVATLFVGGILLVAALALGRDPWADEAMLLANFLVDRPSALFAPMPLFEQAAPLGYRILGMGLAQSIDAVGGIYPAVLALRGLSAAAALLMAWAVFKTTRLHGTRSEAATAAILVSVTPFAIYYGTEIKQYVFEGAASAVLLYAAALTARSANQARSLIIFLACAILGYAFSFLLILVVLACLVAVGVTRLADARGDGAIRVLKLLRDNRGLLVVGAVAITAGILFYLFYSRAVIGYQMTASPDVYDATGGNEAWRAWYELMALFFNMLTPRGTYLPGTGPTQLASAAAFATTLLLVWLGCLRRSLFVGACAAALVLGLVAAHTIGLLPFKAARHLLFILPVLACTIAPGVGEIAALVERRARLRPGRLALPLLAMLGVAYLVGGTTALPRLRTEEVTPLLRHAKAIMPEAPIWVYYAAQPAVRVLGEPATVQLGLLDHRSNSSGWSVGGGARDLLDIRRTSEGYIASAADALGARAAAWLVFAHDLPGDQPRIIGSIGPRYGPCALEARATGTALYLCRRATARGR